MRLLLVVLDDHGNYGDGDGDDDGDDGGDDAAAAADDDHDDDDADADADDGDDAERRAYFTSRRNGVRPAAASGRFLWS